MNSVRPKIAVLLPFLLPLCLACSGEQSPREVSAGIAASRTSDYLSYIPQGANLLFYMNFQELRASPFGRDFRTEVERQIHEDDEEYQEFIRQTGLDLENDIHEVWVGGQTGGDGRDKPNGSAIVLGKFDQNRILDYLRNKSDRRPRETVYEGVDLYIVQDRHSDEIAYAFLDSKTFLIGDVYWLQQTIDLAQRHGDSVLDNPNMADYVRRIPAKQQLWGVVDANNLTDLWANELRKGGSGFQGTESLENLESMIFYAQIGENAKIFLEGNFGTREQAELLAETLNGFKAMAKLMVSDDKEAIDMLNEIKIRSRGEVLDISAQLGKDFFQKLDQKKKKFSGRRFDFM